MELLELKGSVREGRKKGAARSLRRSGQVPGVIYGPAMEPVALSVSTYELSEMIRKNGTSGVFLKLELDGDDKPSRTAMLKDIQMDTFRLDYLHVDFQEINLDEKITVTVPLETRGESLGEKEGGMVQVIRRELDIICRPADVPDAVYIDIDDLNIGDSLHISSVDLGEDVEIPYDVDFTIITVVPPSAEVEEEEDEDEEIMDLEGEEETAEEETPEAE